MLSIMKNRIKSAAILGLLVSFLFLLLKNFGRKRFSNSLSGREPLFLGKRKEIILNSEDFQNEHN